MQRRGKKTALAALLLAAVCVWGAAAARADAHPFTDVAGGAYYEDAVVWALARGVTTGVTATSFQPDGTCNRGQVVTFLWRAKGMPEPQTAENPFADVSASDYCCKAVLWAVENGITNGTSETTFSPRSQCSRAHVLTFLHRAMGQPAPAGASAIADGYEDGLYYKTAVAWADAGGLLGGMGNAPFSAAESCPRRDIVTYLYRFFEGTEHGAAYVRLTPETPSAFRYADVPAYDGSVFVKMHGGEPYFSEENLTAASYEMYGGLDALGRCGVCVANVGTDLMPTAPRGDISRIRPTGWQETQYAGIDGGKLYNRCHLIGYQLTGENANENNLITGTRYFNVSGMLPYENLIAEYVEDYDAHVLYRVTPVFAGTELLARGVLLEGMSCEDRGAAVKFCVFVYNVQPGIEIDYATGESAESGHSAGEQAGVRLADPDYVLNTNTHKFHYPTCRSVADIKEKNRRDFQGTREEILAMGYDPCGICKP